MTGSKSRKGAALILSMIFVLIFSALAASIATLSGTNVQISDNQRHANQALVSAQSGLEVMRYHLAGIKVPGNVLPANRLQAIAAQLQSKLNSAGITNIAANIEYETSTPTITVPKWLLDSESGQAFNAVIAYGPDYNSLTMDITGTSRQVGKKIRVNFNFATTGNTVFDFGIASKGPVEMHGSVEVEGFNNAIEASVYIESEKSNLALEMIGKSSIAGEVKIVNPLAIVALSNASSIYGKTGEDARKHVYIGVPSCDFPTPYPANFEQYVTNTFDPKTNTATNITLENIRIPSGTNPSFSGNVVIRGLTFIEAPNVVRFSGDAQITGIIIGNGDVDSPDAENRIEFLGTVNSYSVSELPDEGFGQLKKEAGTFVLAPGFSVCFGGNFQAINGVIAASGVQFFGNAGGIINGSVVNYGQAAMNLDGNTDLVFNRSGIAKNPAGFEPTKVLEFLPSSYSEPPF
ncbi:MAG: PilX N-terminal domain-containing pilus assembly protein [Sedimentisphaerales bacterium]|nr:PilX N-terminal domain-containing pilus assembly protein [Sedimentisphaerales bacterium]